MANESNAYPLRLPPELKKIIADSAKANGRSFNAEVVFRLEQCLSLQQGTSFPAGAFERDGLQELKALRQQVAILDQKLTNGDWCESAMMRVLKKVIRI